MVISSKEIAKCYKQVLQQFAHKNPDLAHNELHSAVYTLLDRLFVRQICQALQVPTDWVAALLNLELNRFDSNEERRPPAALNLEDAAQWVTALIASPKQPSSKQPNKSLQLPPLSLESLGQLYEQFLRHQSTTRKTRGVYYTTAPLAQYIVHQTLGEMVAGKTVESMTSSPLRLLDPACGAGSFLIAAYQFLLNWYQAQYTALPARYQQYLDCDRTGEWQLTLTARQRILKDHIYGVDIDLKAIAITHRSLLMLMVSGIATESCSARPWSNLGSTLQNNICLGDALIGLDFAQAYPDCSAHVHGLDWNHTFPTVMRSGGFDVIVGNPPWVFTRNAQFNDCIKKYYQTKYLADINTQQVGKMNQKGKINLFTLFLVQSIRLTRPYGQLGILIPNTLLRTTLYDAIRKYILDHCNIKQIVELNNDSFTGVTADLSILILDKTRSRSIVKLYRGIQQTSPTRLLDQTTFFSNPGYVFSTFLDQPKIQLFRKIEQSSIHLGDLTQNLIEGIVCRSDQISSYPFDIQHRKLLEGKDINRYAITFREKYVLFDRSQIHRPRPNYIWHAKEKIILRRIAGGELSLISALDTENYYTFASTNNLLLKESCPYNIRYILALLNSRLLNCYYAQKFTNYARLTVNIPKTFIQQLPIHILNLDIASEKKKHDQLVELVDVMCILHKKLSSETIASERQNIQHNIQSVDYQIDKLIHELYQLTDAEIDMIKTPAASQANRCSSTSRYQEETFLKN